MVKLNQAVLSLFVVAVVAISLWIFAGDKGIKPFKEMTMEEQIKFLGEQANKHKTDVAELVDYFEQNWDKDSLETVDYAVRVNFCNLMKVFRAKEAVPLLVKHFDMIDYRKGADRPREPLEDCFILPVLAEIGTPSLELTTDRICSELEKLKYSEDTRHRIGFLKDVLKYLTVEILGKKLAIVFLEDKISGKDVSPQLKESVSFILNEIKQR